MIYYFIIFITFIIMNLLVVGIGFNHFPFYAMESILIPYNFIDGRIVFSQLLFNYVIIAIFTMSISKTFNEMFSISSYILSRIDKKRAFILYLSKTAKKVILLLMIKFVADILTGQINGLLKVDIFIKYYISSFVTLFIWILITFLLHILKVSESKINFNLLSSLFLIQYLSFTNRFLGVFVIATINMLDKFWFWIALKIWIIVILLVVCYITFIKYENIGVIKDD